MHPSKSDAMENLVPPPVPKPGPGDPVPATGKQQSALAPLAGHKSIKAAAAAYKGSCVGGDKFDNNCAHFLSDAFLRAGYKELAPSCDCINARCTPAGRPIRARDMWCWFQQRATKTADKLPKNQGLWAVFQLKESEYWGGHVVIIDTDSGTYYGTGNYPDWDQHCYWWPDEDAG